MQWIVVSLTFCTPLSILFLLDPYLDPLPPRTLTNPPCIANHLLHSVGAVPVLIALLSSEYINVCEQAVWALGNITGDGPECRDFVIRAGIIPPLLKFVHQATPVSIVM